MRLIREKELVNSQWKGYRSELFMKTITRTNIMKDSWNVQQGIIQELLFALEPYYDRLISNEEGISTLMISSRQIYTFQAFMFRIREQNVTEAIHELTDFVNNYGLYRNHEFSELETYLIYVGLQQIEMLFIKEGNALNIVAANN